ncbi:hypothetical protein [Chitinophaga sp.]|uniref:hypothetical protein n=1 Tax=Chitinophaga sp. TaxID=1869181 RepID=UPI0031CF4732
MKEQPSIFDDSFEAGLKLRRRALMPLILKIYLIVFALYGAYLIIGRFYFIYKLIFLYSRTSMLGINGMSFYLIILRSLLGAIVIVATILSMWMEWKWAIRFNWAVLIYWTLMGVVDYVSGNGYGIYLGVMALLLAPYFSILYQIQKRWEREAVSGRELRQRK